MQNSYLNLCVRVENSHGYFVVDRKVINVGFKRLKFLMLKYIYFRSSVVDFLLDKGAPSVVSDINGNTPLHIACIR